MPVILYCKGNAASFNIAKYLMETEFQEKGDGVYARKDAFMYEVKLESILEIYSPAPVKDFAVVLSTHRSESGESTLTTHAPGNWGKAEMGGKDKTLNKSYGSFMRGLLLNLKEKTETRKLDYKVGYEVDHHGPSVDFPIMFAEVGSGEAQWNDEKACSALGDSILETLDGFDKVPNFIGVGGGHYAPKFTKISFDEEKAFPHILPKYHVDAVDDKMLIQAINKSVEKVEGFVIDKKGLASSQRKRILELIGGIGASAELV